MNRSHLLFFTSFLFVLTTAFQPATPPPSTPECKLFVPNVFSPNGDGLNDEFKAFTDCSLLKFEIKVFTRWGALVYEGNSIDDGWDGKYKGNIAKSDSYVYYIKYAFDDDKGEEAIAGEVSLLK